MSQKKAKQIRRAVRKESQKIKVKGLDEFMRFAKNQPLRKRIIFAFRMIFKLH